MQNYEQEVQVCGLEPGFLARASEVFHDLHRDVYGYSFEHDPVEFVHCGLTAYESRLPVFSGGGLRQVWRGQERGHTRDR